MGNGYWEKRYLQDKAAAINRSEKYIADQQRKYYVAAQKEIREDIESLYQTFVDKEDITLAEAKRRISRADFSKVDFEKLVDYQIERNRKFLEKKEKLPGDVVAAIEKQHARYESGLRAYTKKGQITRLELLSLQIDKAMLDLYDKNQISMYDCLSQIYEDGYYRSVFAGQKAIGFGKDFTAPNTRAIERAVLTSYNKKGYSKRLYGHCSTFSKDLKENLITGFIKGESIDKMSARISRRLDVSAAHARRLVRTETAYVYEQASLKAYQECGIEKYEFLATLDHKTSPPCQALDGKRFYIKDAVPGKNYPPMHPNCRSTTVAAFDDDKVTKRLAKDESGKYYEVPSDMTYPEWKKVYVDGGGKISGLQEATPDGTIKKEKNKRIENLTTFKELKEYLKQKHNVDMTDSVGALDFLSIREGTEGIERILQEFPQAAPSLQVIGTRKDGLMCASYNGEIFFNPGYYKRREDVLAAHGNGVQYMHPKGNNAYGTGCHEAGHILEKALIDKANGGPSAWGKIQWDDMFYTKAVVGDACKAAKKLPECKGMRNGQLKDAISAYAGRGSGYSASETMAEAVCDYALNGERAAPLSKEIWKILKKELG